MEFKTLSTFCCVAQLQSFSKAANQLGYTQAAVTLQIKRLEEELGVRLFDRFSRTIALTQQGELLLLHASEILQACNQVKTVLQEETTIQGPLHIGLIESLCSSLLPDLIENFHNTYPEVTIELTIDSPEKLFAMLNHNKIDIIYFIDKKVYDLNWIKVLEEPEEIVFVTHPNHPLCDHKQLTLQTILNENLILTERNASYRHELEQQACARGLCVQPYLEIGDTSFLINLLLKNMGISFLPKFTIESYLIKKQLVLLEPIDFSMQVSRQMIYHKMKWPTSQMKAFLKMASTFKEYKEDNV